MTDAATLNFKGKSSAVQLEAGASTDVLFDAAAELTGAADLRIIFKGKQLAPGLPISETPLAGAKAPKLMVMATAAKVVADVQAARSDPTIRGFAAEDDAAKRLKESSTADSSEWAAPQHSEYKFCRFEMCTWQSFGHRPSSKTPHAFAARALLIKLAQARRPP